MDQTIKDLKDLIKDFPDDMKIVEYMDYVGHSFVDEIKLKERIHIETLALARDGTVDDFDGTNDDTDEEIQVLLIGDFSN